MNLEKKIVGEDLPDLTNRKGLLLANESFKVVEEDLQRDWMRPRRLRASFLFEFSSIVLRCAFSYGVVITYTTLRTIRIRKIVKENRITLIK
jgi:hypothetical protein